MSDVSQGPGWWQASDGKWYAPELYPSDWPEPNPTLEPEPQAAPQPEPEPAVETPPTEPVVVEPEPVVEAPVEPVVTEPVMPEPEWVAAEPEAVASEPVPPQVSVPDATAVVEPVPAPPVSDPTVQMPPVGTAEPPQWQMPAPTPPVVPGPAPESPAGPPVVGEQTLPSAPLPPPGAAGAPVPARKTRRSSPDVLTALLGVAAGALLIVASFLDWAVTVGDDFTGAVNGLSDSNGWGTLITGAIVVLGALLAVAGWRKWWVGAGLGVTALVASGLVVYSLVDISNLSRDLPALLVANDQPAELAVNAGLEFDIGMWLAIAGSGVALCAAMASLARRSSGRDVDTAVAETPAPPATLSDSGAVSSVG